MLRFWSLGWGPDDSSFPFSHAHTSDLSETIEGINQYPEGGGGAGLGQGSGSELSWLQEFAGDGNPDNPELLGQGQSSLSTISFYDPINSWVPQQFDDAPPSPVPLHSDPWHRDDGGLGGLSGGDVLATWLFDDVLDPMPSQVSQTGAVTVAGTTCTSDLGYQLLAYDGDANLLAYAAPAIHPNPTVQHPNYEWDPSAPNINSMNAPSSSSAPAPRTLTQMQPSQLLVSSSSSPSTLDAPSRRWIPEERKHHCNICEKSYRRARELRDHMHTHSRRRSKPYRCESEGCHKAYTTRANMLRHFNQQHTRTNDVARIHQGVNQRTPENTPLEFLPVIGPLAHHTASTPHPNCTKFSSFPFILCDPSNPAQRKGSMSTK